MSNKERKNGRNGKPYKQELLRLFVPHNDELWRVEYATADLDTIRVNDEQFRYYAVHFDQAYPTQGGAAVPVSTWHTLQRSQPAQQIEYRFVFYDPVKEFYFVQKIPVEAGIDLDIEVPSSVWPTRPA